MRKFFLPRNLKTYFKKGVIKVKAKIEPVYDAVFVEKISKNSKILLIAGAGWCGDTIRFMREILPKYLEIVGKEVKIFYATIETENYVLVNPEIKAKLEIVRYPTLFAYVDGEKLASKEADNIPKQEDDLKDMLSALGVKIAP